MGDDCTQCTHLLPGTNTKLASRYACSALPSRPALTSVPQAIDALEECHVEHNVAKFWGVCNGFKDALDECLKQEVRPNQCKCFPVAMCSKTLLVSYFALFSATMRPQ